VLRVERSNDRIYKDEEYAAVGAEIVPTGSWVNAPKDHIILGLKEFPLEIEQDYPHTYIHFQHCFKGQTGWDKAVDRFSRAGGTLYDLEFLEQVRREGGKKDGKPIIGGDGKPLYVRTAAFGWSAGYAGTAIALLAWAHQVLHPGEPQGEVKPFDTTEELVNHVKEALQPAIEKEGGRKPHTIVIGALGRCGKGAIAFLEQVGFTEDHITKWDQDETRDNPGPYDEVAEADIFVNAVYLTTKIPPFITFKSLSQNPKRRLRVVTDVSCDPNRYVADSPIPSPHGEGCVMCSSNAS
jgi:saccharopine dehydrogenase (NAD+, L-lysine-forming)